MGKLALLTILLCLVTACAPVSAAQVPGVVVPGVVAQGEASERALLPQVIAQVAEQSTGRPRADDPRLAHLWIDMSMAPTLVDLFNEYGGDADIARADHVSLIDLLDKTEVGRRVVVFKNAADIEVLVPRLADKMDIIGYNLEHGPANRPDEQRDPVSAMRRVRAVADLYGLQVAMGPDRGFALNYGVELAPYADYFVLQVQRVQTEPETVRDFVIPLTQALRAANPELKISIQVRTDGDIPALVELIASLSKSIDGVSILTNDETGAVAAELLAALRPVRSSATDPQPPVPVQGGTPVVLPETPGPRRTAPATLVPQVTPAPPREGTLGRVLVMWAGLLALGVLAAGVVTTAILYAVKGTRGR